MQTKSRNFTLLTLIAALLVFSPFAGLPLLVSRHLVGRKAFYAVQLSVMVFFLAVGLMPFAVFSLASTLLIGIFVDLRLRFNDVALAGIMAMASSLAAAATLGAGYVGVKGVSELTRFKTEMEAALTASGSQVNFDVVWMHSLGVASFFLILALTFAVVIEAHFLPRLRGEGTQELKRFTLPGPLIWLMVAGTLGAYLEAGQPNWVQIVSIDVFGLLVVGYMLQGLAILATLFKALDVGVYWHWVLYVLVVLKMYGMASALGFSDYWLDYRQRILKRASDPRKRI